MVVLHVLEFKWVTLVAKACDRSAKLLDRAKLSSAFLASFIPAIHSCKSSSMMCDDHVTVATTATTTTTVAVTSSGGSGVQPWATATDTGDSSTTSSSSSSSSSSIMSVITDVVLCSNCDVKLLD